MRGPGSCFVRPVSAALESVSNTGQITRYKIRTTRELTTARRKRVEPPLHRVDTVRMETPADADRAGGPVRMATLGPAGTNHELVARRYLDFHGAATSGLRLVGAFREAVALLKSGEVDVVLQCAVHPDAPHTLGANFRDIFAIDCFISDSRPLAILTRTDVAEPQSIGLVMPATESYADLRRWKTKHPYTSIPLAFADLLAGRIDSALVYRDQADAHPGLLRVDEEIGSPDDVWIVYGRERALGGGLLAARGGGFARLLRARRGSGAEAGRSPPPRQSQRSSGL